MGGKKRPGYTMKYRNEAMARYCLWSKIIASWPAPKRKSVSMSEGDFMAERTLTNGMIKNTVTGFVNEPTTTKRENE